MTAKVTLEGVEEFAQDADLIREHVVVDAKGGLSLPKENMQPVLDRHGATTEVVKTFHAAHSHLFGAGGIVLGEHLINRVKEDLASGGTGERISVALKIPTYNGQTELRAESSRVFPNNMAGDDAPKTVTRYGRLGVFTETKRHMPKSVAASLEAATRGLIGGDAPAPEEAKVKLPTAG